MPIAKGEVIRLNNIFFDFGKATLRAESYPEWDRLVTLLKTNQDLKIELGGHTDNVGTEINNLKLSQRRAQACYDYLLSKGISPNTMNAGGFGESNPIADNSTPEGRSLNRRVEFILAPR